MTSQSPTARLQGCPVELIISDPWELVDASGDNAFSGQISQVAAYAEGAENERALLVLDAPVTWKGKQYRYLVASARDGHGMVDDLLGRHPVDCSVIGVPDSDVADTPTWGAEKWRGGLAATARLTVSAAS